MKPTLVLAVEPERLAGGVVGAGRPSGPSARSAGASPRRAAGSRTSGSRPGRNLTLSPLLIVTPCGKKSLTSTPELLERLARLRRDAQVDRLGLGLRDPRQREQRPHRVRPAALQRPVTCCSSLRARIVRVGVGATLVGTGAARQVMRERRVNQPRRRIQSASARASMRAVGGEDRRRAAVLAALAAEAPADDGDRLARPGRARAARRVMRASRLGARRPTAAACSSGSPAPPTTISERRALRRRRRSTAPVSPGARPAPEDHAEPVGAAGRADLAGANVVGPARRGRRAAASRASSTRGPVRRLEVQRQRRGRPRRSASRRRAASRGRRRGARARAACRAAPGGAGSPAAGPSTWRATMPHA